MAAVRVESKQIHLCVLKSFLTHCGILMATANERSSTAGGAIKNFMTTGRLQLIKFIYLGISELAIVLTRPDLTRLAFALQAFTGQLDHILGGSRLNVAST